MSFLCNGCREESAALARVIQENTALVTQAEQLKVQIKETELLRNQEPLQAAASQVHFLGLIQFRFRLGILANEASGIRALSGPCNCLECPLD